MPRATLPALWATPPARWQTYDQVLGSLSPVEVVLMSSRINDLRETMRPGQAQPRACMRVPPREPVCVRECLRTTIGPRQVALNWNSLGITSFIQDCNKAIQLFQSYVHQMQKSASAIEQVRASACACGCMRVNARACERAGAAQIVEMIRTESIVPLTLEGASGETLDLQVPSP
jgi:hypothetical protein